MNDRTIIVKNDEFGSQRFADIKLKLSTVKASKELQARFNKAESVFLHRTQIAHEHALAEDGWRGPKEQLRQRLIGFKPVNYFLDVAQAILDEAKKEEASELQARLAKKKPVIQRGWSTR